MLRKTPWWAILFLETYAFIIAWSFILGGYIHLAWPVPSEPETFNERMTELTKAFGFIALVIYGIPLSAQLMFKSEPITKED